MSDPRTVSVDLAERSYDILIGAGLLHEAGGRIATLAPGTRAVVVTDRTVDALHGDALRRSLDAAGVGHETIAVPSGERSKSWDTLRQVVEAILAGRFERGDVVVALGGGVVGDLAGFAAAVARRGMAFVQVPTSLLAQVDSSVGGKTGINSGQGKNLVGAFHQPALVLIDTDLLQTLSDREFRAGYAEVVKYGLIDRPDFFDWLDANLARLLARDADALTHAIATSCEAKAAVVAADEREDTGAGGQRALLNLGHTFGHALEAACGYDAARIVHGEGVAIGCVLAHDFSASQGLAQGNDGARVADHLSRASLPTAIADLPGPAIAAPTLMAAISQDKKAARGRLTFILTRGIGRAFVARDVDAGAVRNFLEERL